MMFRNKVVLGSLIAAAVSLAAPVAGFAQATRDTGWYIGGSVGQSKAKDVCEGAGAFGISCDDKDTAWRILGGYQINRNFAAEFGYHDLGKATFSVPGASEDLKANAWELVGIGAWPFANQFSVYGKLGFFRGELKGLGAKETNTDLTYGIGGRYDFNRNVGLRLEYQVYKDLGGGDFGDKTDVNVISLGVIYKFQ